MMMMVMTRLRQRPRAIDARSHGKFEWQENLEEQRGDR
jgi:hypothetical protein